MNRWSEMKQVSYLLLITGILSCSLVHAQQVGEVQYARGAVTVQQQDGSGARLIGRGDMLDTGEVMKTGPKSFAVIKLADETRMTLRPQSSFAVEQMNAETTSNGTALLKLFRGGVRVNTGYISKNNPIGFRVRTPTATIGINGTEFDARICNEDCASENKILEDKLENKQARIIGRVALKRGRMSARNFVEIKRELITGSDLYEGDTLTTSDNSYALIVFRDKSRVSLQPNTQFRIDELRYDSEQPSGASALFSLLRGGLRAVTGLIGKLRPEGYRMRTRFSTIGIRGTGTGYDLLCTGPCGGGRPPNIVLPKGDGLYASVWNGTITLNGRILDVSQAAFIKNASTRPILLSRVPGFFRNNPVPKPNEIKVDDIEFPKIKSQNIPPGLYTSVREGEVTVMSDKTNKLVIITKGQSAFADATGRQVKQLASIPVFQKLDIYPTPDKVTANSVNIGSGAFDDEEGLVCEVK